MKAWLAIDNGVTGSLAFITEKGKVRFAPTPVRKQQNYTKKEQNITRVDGNKLYSWIIGCLELIPMYTMERDEVVVILERPFVNPKGFMASMSALRCLEAQLIILESLQLGYLFMDSKEWQRVMLPAGCEGDDLKVQSLEVGNRFFPQFSDSKCKDRDSLLMAEYARRNNL